MITFRFDNLDFDEIKHLICPIGFGISSARYDIKVTLYFGNWAMKLSAFFCNSSCVGNSFNFSFSWLFTCTFQISPAQHLSHLYVLLLLEAPTKNEPCSNGLQALLERLLNNSELLTKTTSGTIAMASLMLLLICGTRRRSSWTLSCTTFGEKHVLNLFACLSVSFSILHILNIWCVFLAPVYNCRQNSH